MRAMKTSEFANTPFKGLKSALEKRRFPLRERDVKQDKSDEDIFREAMADVREITEYRMMSAAAAPPPNLPPCRKDDSIDILTGIVKGETKMRISDTSEYMAWVKPNIRRDILERLHGGDFSVQDSIDLHGMTLVEAEEALSRFFKSSVRRGLFCVKVIHGRGLRSPHGPVLKEALKRLLHRSFSKWVLAYATARNNDGGLGATYIILQ